MKREYRQCLRCGKVIYTSNKLGSFCSKCDESYIRWQ